MRSVIARLLPLLVVVPLVAGASAPVAASATTIPLAFAPGAYSGQASTTLSGWSSVRTFSFSAHQGQVLVLVTEARNGTRTVLRVAATGKTIGGGPGGRVFDGLLPTTGTYLVEVRESPMGQPWSGQVSVVALIY